MGTAIKGVLRDSLSRGGDCIESIKTKIASTTTTLKVLWSNNKKGFLQAGEPLLFLPTFLPTITQQYVIFCHPMMYY